MGHTGGVAEHPVPELPSYLGDDRPARPAPAAPRVTARDVANRVGTWVTEIVEGDGELAPSTSLDTHADATKDDVIVVHRVLGPPPALLDAFDRRWGTQPSRLRTATGTLDLRPADEVDGSGAGARGAATRLLAGRLSLRLSLRTVPVELEVVPWHTYGLVLTLRPVRGAAAVRRHRRWVWFSTGHRALDQMRRALEGAS